MYINKQYCMFTRTDIILYLEDVIEQLKSQTISEENIRDFSILYMKHMFKENVEDDVDKNNNLYDESKQLNYLVLGWYIYTFLLDKK